MGADHPNGPAREDVLAFVERSTGKRLSPLQEADVLQALGLDGKKAATFIQAFAKEFGVDLAGYEWRFHHVDEGTLRQPGWPVRPGHPSGVRMPLAVSTLVLAARTGRWPVHYPVPAPTAPKGWLNVLLIVVGLPVFVILLLLAFRAVV